MSLSKKKIVENLSFRLIDKWVNRLIEIKIVASGSPTLNTFRLVQFFLL